MVALPCCFGRLAGELFYILRNLAAGGIKHLCASGNLTLSYPIPLLCGVLISLSVLCPLSLWFLSCFVIIVYTENACMSIDNIHKIVVYTVCILYT